MIVMWWDSFLWWFSGFLPYRQVSEGDQEYLDRYYLFSVGQWRFYLHCFVGSDPDRGLHDHPWQVAFSFVLCGWYLELTTWGMRKIKWFNFLTGDSKHKVILPGDVKRCWTLFIHKGVDLKPWGFYRPAPAELDPEGLGIMIFTPWKKFTPGMPETKWWKTAGRRGEPRW